MTDHQPSPERNEENMLAKRRLRLFGKGGDSRSSSTHDPRALPSSDFPNESPSLEYEKLKKYYENNSDS